MAAVGLASDTGFVLQTAGNAEYLPPRKEFLAAFAQGCDKLDPNESNPIISIDGETRSIKLKENKGVILAVVEKVA
ncbi:unnamed protein product [Symbiodinium natans]|uniref:Late endosomal/lysosomal adaptor and MAPK and MTOR activator 5 n=1 Tax=Symbiodinium natans TaxID=878477 RepID=A0A812FY54_9DINO|nr:unnamed protein product [Symbiodinium natans]